MTVRRTLLTAFVQMVRRPDASQGLAVLYNPCSMTDWLIDDGKIFVSGGGNYMKIQCNAHVDSATALATTPLSTFSECLNYCSDTPGCARCVNHSSSLVFFRGNTTKGFGEIS